VLLLLALLLAWQTATPAPASSPTQFFDFSRTMRVDYHHGGGPAGETFALDRVVNDGAWPGSRTQLIDATNLGKYLIEVREKASGALVYSRGFASIYGEWETTPEVKVRARMFHESARIPWPSGAVTVTVRKRQRDNSFKDAWVADVDPASPGVNQAALTPVPGSLSTIMEHGPAAEKVDLLIIGEGYTRAQLPKFQADAKRLLGSLFAQEPFKSRQRDFNVRALGLPSQESGVNRPNAGVFRRTPISAEYNIFGSERYVLTLDNRALRDAASVAPYEFIEILVNDATYGGGGIFNDQATTSVDSAFSDYVFVHEFGHHFAALADEYYTSEVAYETGVADLPEPWEPNVTALKDPAGPKWRDLIAPGTPIPTPWEKDRFEQESRATQERRRAIRARNAPESEMDALFRAQQEREERLLGGMRYARTVGAFEGASYEARGLYRPEADCIMFTRNRVSFCRVCRRAIERIIDLYSR
jgi:hypothetical protein